MLHLLTQYLTSAISVGEMMATIEQLTGVLLSKTSGEPFHV